MATIRSLYVALKADTSDYNKKMKEAATLAGDFNRLLKPSVKALNDVGQAATKVGAGLTAGITLPLAAIGTASVLAAKEFESSFAGVRKTVDATEKEFGELEAGFRNMSKTIPVSVNELNKIGEAAGQLGIKKEDILQFTRTMADLGVTTNLTSDAAATATAQIQNIFGAAGKDVDRFGATLVALGNAGASTEKDIIDMSLRIAGAGNQVGLTQAQVLSFASTLSSVGINAEAGGSAISRVFLKINDSVASGGDKLTEFARIAGMNSALFKQAFQNDAAKATVAFINGLGRLKAEGENVNATLEGVVGKNIILKDTLLRASGAGQLLADTLALGDEAWQKNAALVIEANERYKTFDSQLQVFRNSLGDVAITIGKALLPILTTVLETMKPVIAAVAAAAEWFAALPKPIQAVSVAVLAAAAALGPMLLAFGLIATSVAGAIPVLVTAAGAIAGLGAPVLAAVAAAGVMVTAITGVGIAIGAFIANNEQLRSTLIEAWEQTRQAAGDVWTQVVDIFRTVSTAFKEIWGEWGPGITVAFGVMVQIATQMIKNLGAAISAGLKIVSGILQAFHGLATADFTKFSAGIEKIWSVLWATIKGIVNSGIAAVKALIVNFTLAVSNAFKAMYDAVVGNSYVPDMVEGIRDSFGMLDEFMVDPTRRAAHGVMSSFKNMFDTVLEFARDWKGSLKGLLDDFLGGIDLKSILKGDFGSILQSAKDVLGLGGGGKSGSGGILGGILGGSGGGAAGTVSGLAGKLNPIGMGLGIANTGFDLASKITGKIGAGRDSANEIVKSQNAFQKTIEAILSDASLSDTNKLKMVGNESDIFRSNIGQWIATGGENAVTGNQALATINPWISAIKSDLVKKGASDSSSSGGGNTFNVTYNISLDGVTDVPTLIDWIKRNFGGLTEEMVRQVELREGTVVSR